MSTSLIEDRLPAWVWRTTAGGLLAGLVLLFFRGWVGAGLPSSPRSELIPQMTYVWQVADYLRAGRLYVDWDPSFFSGYPWLRYLPYPMYYLLAVLSLLPGLSLPLVLKLFIMSTYIISAWSMAALAMDVTQGAGKSAAWGAGLVAGAVYALFPFHLWLGMEIMHHAAFWAVLPLPFLVYERWRRGALGTYAAGLALGLLLALFAVLDSEHTIIVAPFWLGYVLLGHLRQPGQPWRELWGLLLGAGLLSLAVSAFYWLPALFDLGNVGILARFGAGGTAGAQFARDTGLSLSALLSAIADRAKLAIAAGEAPAIVYGFFGANAWYVGLVALWLALVGLGQARRTGAAAIAGLLLAMAFAWSARAWLPINLFAGIPIFGTLSGFRGMLLIGFFVSLLAGLGAARLLAHLDKKAAAVLALAALCALFVDRRATKSYLAEAAVLLGMLFLCLWLIGRRRWQRLLGPACLALLLLSVLVDYRTAAAAVVDVPRYFEQDEVDAYRWLSQQGSDFRVWEYSDLYDDAEFRHTYSLAYNQAPRFGGYFDNGATRGQWHVYKSAKPDRGEGYLDETALTSALRLSGVRYILVHRRLQTYQQALAVPPRLGYDRVAWQSANVTVFENPQPPAQAAVYYSAAAPTAAPVTRLAPGRLAVQAEAAGPGLLVLGESWHPGWRATVDGQPAPIVQSKGAFIGVELDAGAHEVLYSYEPPLALRAGWLISLASALLLLARQAAVPLLARRNQSARAAFLLR